MQIKLIFTRKVVHLASFWKWGFSELGSGLLDATTTSATSTTNRPFQSCPKPLFQSQAKCEVTDIKMIFFILMHIKPIFTRQVLHLASLWKQEFLELRNGQLVFKFSLAHACDIMTMFIVCVALWIKLTYTAATNLYSSSFLLSLPSKWMAITKWRR